LAKAEYETVGAEKRIMRRCEESHRQGPVCGLIIQTGAEYGSEQEPLCFVRTGLEDVGS